jgi:hypothetical protein
MRELDPPEDGTRRAPRPDPPASRGRLRVWLKMALQTGVLDRVPDHHGPSGRSTLEYARDLFSELQSAHLSTQPPAALLTEIRAFREWVEARQRTSRRAILAEPSREDLMSYRLGRPKKPTAPAALPSIQSPRRRSDTADTPVNLDPLWDRWMDE